MELKRIVANDLRSATQEAVRLYGPTTLVVSSERINGKMEVIAAVDIKAEPEFLDSNSIMTKNKDVKTNSLSEEIAGESFENILSESLEKKKLVKISNKNSFNDDQQNQVKSNKFAQETSNQPSRQREKETVRPSLEPKFNFEDFTNTIKPIKPKKDNLKFTSVNKSHPSKNNVEGITLGTEKDKIDSESLRAREIVDLVLREFSDMKKEFKLAQKVAQFNSTYQVPIEIKSVVDSLNEANIPIGLRTLLIEGIADCNSVNEALDGLKSQLNNSIDAEKNILNNVPTNGVHVFSGPTGSGKTSMLMKIISSAMSGGVSEENIAVISYKDTRLGAWTQTQMSCAQVGVEAFKVKDTAFLKNLCDELGGKTLILIDTAGIGREKNLEEIKSSLEHVDFHLVLASDSSPSAFGKFIESEGFDWKSLFVSKFDECVAPWGLLQSMINSDIPIASIWGTGPASFDFEKLSKEKLVEKAFHTLMISHDDQVLVNNETDKMIFETFKGFSSEGTQ